MPVESAVEVYRFTSHRSDDCYRYVGSIDHDLARARARARATSLLKDLEQILAEKDFLTGAVNIAMPKDRFQAAFKVSS